MPVMQVTIHDLNERFSPGSVGLQSVADFDEDLALHQVIVDQLRIGGDIPGFREFLQTAPDGFTKAFSATIRSAIAREQPITFAWKPGYEWELNITDVADAATPGGITMIVSTRFPGDASPVDSSAR